MKKSTAILLLSQARQELLDMMNKTVQTFTDINNQHFDSNTKNNVMAEVMAAINNCRIIEAELYDALGISYTRKIYNPAVDGYMVQQNAPIPQFTQLSACISHYDDAMAQLKADIEAEQLETKFISDDNDTLNQTFDKSADYLQAETDIIASIVVIKASLIGDNPDSAVS